MTKILIVVMNAFCTFVCIYTCTMITILIGYD